MKPFQTSPFKPFGKDASSVSRSWLYAVLTACGLCYSAYASAQQCAVPGRDGVATVTTAPNTYYSASSPTLTGGATKALTLGTLNPDGAPTLFAPGDLLLIIQMQDSTGALEGNFEYARVTTVAGSAITLAANLTNSYAQSISPTSLQTYQIIRVPQYSSATVSGTVNVPPWSLTNGGAGSGGVFVMDVTGTLTMNGTINANGAGFRGGYGVSGGNGRAGGTFDTANYTPILNNMNGALKGEGTNGVPDRVFTGVAAATVYTAGLYALGTAGQGANSNAGGGGNDGIPATGNNGQNSGGGGGGNAGVGGSGGNSYTSNNAAGGRGGLSLSSSASKLYLGGGGGAGSANNLNYASVITTYPPSAPAVPNIGNRNPNGANGAEGPVSASGARGGGIVIVRASTMAYQSGGIQANGVAAYSTWRDQDGAGGGGAGGSVIVQAASSTGTLPISAVGGRGGNSPGGNHGPGAGGGGGFIGVSGVSTTTTTTGGTNGLDASNTPSAYGATPGTTGTTNTGLTAAPTGASAFNACLPALTVVKSTSTPERGLSYDTTATYTVVVSNAAGLGDAIGVNVVDDLPAPFTYFNTPAPTVVYAGGASGPASPITAITTGTDPVAFGTAAGNATNSFTIPGGGSVTITFTVNLNGAGVGTYQNPASTNYADPTRSAAGQTTTPGAAHATGGTTALGSNYASASTTNDDVSIIARAAALTINKTDSKTISNVGGTNTYTITVANAGPNNANGTVLTDVPGAGLNCPASSVVTCAVVTAGAPAASCPAGPLTVANLTTGITLGNITANSSLAFTFTCNVP